MPTHRRAQLRRLARRRFVIRYGIVRCGLPLGLVVLAWLSIARFDTTLEHLATAAGWLRFSALAVLVLAEWTIGAGSLLGLLFWAFRRRRRRRRRTGRRPDRE